MKKNFIIVFFSRQVSHICTCSKFFVSLLVCVFCRIHKGRVLLWSTVGRDYSCNPLYISNYILNNEPRLFEIYWMFRKSVNTEMVDPRVKQVYFGSLKYLYILHTSEFIITNHRTSPKMMWWIKRAKQKYIMTWHGSMPLKMIGKDAENAQSENYIKLSKVDSAICDLMISDSEWYTKIIRNSLGYNGLILEKGMPRNDILFERAKHEKIREKVVSALGISQSNISIVMYAPTFRTNHKTDNYILQWHRIIEKLTLAFNKQVYVLLRLHPTLLEEINTSDLISEDYVINASNYYNMQELLVASDILITDYSSTMFEYSLLRKPCFLYVPDLNTYDRGLYFPIKSLPFALSNNENELIYNILSNNNEAYVQYASDFLNNTFHLYECKNASQSLVEWMKENSLR